jgi:hypothetical protein
MSRARWSRALLIFALLVAALGLPNVSAAHARAAHKDSARTEDAVRLPSLVVETEARAIVTVPVAVPKEIDAGARVTYTVRAVPGAGIVGRATGVLAARTSGARALILTLRVPTDLGAGDLEIAEVEFRVAGQEPVVQPITVRIPLRREVQISGAGSLASLRAGDRVELAYQITNAGNALEALSVRLLAPAGWPIRNAGPRGLELARRGAAEFVASVAIPRTVGIGDHLVVIEASSVEGADTTLVASFRTVLRVYATVDVNPGLTLTPVVAMAASSDGAAAFAGASIEGPVTEEITVRARLLPRARRSGIVVQGLSSGGARGAPYAATVTGRDWQVNAGNALSRFSDLAGVNIMGEGITASGRRDRFEGRVMAARPMRDFGASGSLFGAGLWRDADFGRIGGSATVLAERGGFSRGRELTAVAAEWESLPVGTLTFGSSLAYRSSQNTAGMGYGFLAAHERDGEAVQLRVTHAPGGSAAFARATDELQLQGAKTITDRWSVDAAVNRTRDIGNVFRSLQQDAWTLGQRYALSPEAAVSLRAQVSRFDAQAEGSTFGAFGSGDRNITAGYSWRRGGVSYSADGSLGAVTRRSQLVDGRTVESVAGQQSLRVHASRALARLGALDASAGVQITESGLGFPTDIWTAAVRWSSIPLEVLERAVRLDTELQYQRLSQLQSFVVMRATMITSLPRGLDLAVSAERNPYFRDAAGGAGWIAAMRLSATTAVFAPAAHGPEGVVYEDLNRNGRRDAGEPGVAGVMLRRGDAKATTDRAGRYRLPSRERGRTRVEQGSLPAGLLAHPLLAVDSLERRDIPVLATGTVRLDLRLVPDEDGRVPDVDLGDATLTLRDETGFEWVGRRLNGSTVVFQDVPIGTYAPLFDFSRLREPLLFDAGGPVVVEARVARTVEMQLRGRAVRVIVPPSPSGTGDRGGRGGLGGTPGGRGGLKDLPDRNEP